MSDLYYQSLIFFAGHQYKVVESYESIVERMRGTAASVSGDEDEMRFAMWAPLELTIQMRLSDEVDGPVRLAISPQALSGVIAIPEAYRWPVEEPEEVEA